MSTFLKLGIGLLAALMCLQCGQEGEANTSIHRKDLLSTKKVERKVNTPDEMVCGSKSHGGEFTTCSTKSEYCLTTIDFRRYDKADADGKFGTYFVKSAECRPSLDEASSEKYMDDARQRFKETQECSGMITCEIHNGMIQVKCLIPGKFGSR